jgi:hypothetical protein
LKPVDIRKQNKPQLGCLDSMGHLEAKKRSGFKDCRKGKQALFSDSKGFVLTMVFSGRELLEAPRGCACVISFEIFLNPSLSRL